jgi:hypothetical protein
VIGWPAKYGNEEPREHVIDDGEYADEREDPRKEPTLKCKNPQADKGCPELKGRI